MSMSDKTDKFFFLSLIFGFVLLVGLIVFWPRTSNEVVAQYRSDGQECVLIEHKQYDWFYTNNKTWTREYCR